MAKKSFLKKLLSAFKPKKRSKKRSRKGFGQVDPTTLGVGAVVAVGLAAVAAKRKRDKAKADAAAAAAQAAIEAGLSPEEAAQAAAAAAAEAGGEGGGGGSSFDPSYYDAYSLPAETSPVPGTVFESPTEEVPTNGGTTTAGSGGSGATPPGHRGGFVPSNRNGGGRVPFTPQTFDIPTTTATRPVVRATVPVRKVPAAMAPAQPLPSVSVPTTVTAPVVQATTIRAPVTAIRAPTIRGLAFTAEEADPLPPLTNMGFAVRGGSLVAVPTREVASVPRYRSPRRPTLVRPVASPVIGTTSKTTQVLNESQTTALRTLRALRGFGGIGRCGVEEG